jgi:hypothetical protein
VLATFWPSEFRWSPYTHVMAKKLILLSLLALLVAFGIKKARG